MPTHTKMFDSLLRSAKKMNLKPAQLAKKNGLDLSSAINVLKGKAARPSFAMACGLANATGHAVTIEKVKTSKRGRRNK